MIQVAHLFHTSGPGGAEAVLVSLVRGLDSRRFKSFPCVRESSWMHKQLDDNGYIFHFLKDARSFDIAFLTELVSFLKKENIDVVHSHEFFMNFYGTLAAHFAGIPSIATIHGKLEYAAHKLRRRVACRFIAVGGCVITVSEQLARRLHAEVGVPERRIRTIYNGIDMEPFQSVEDVSGLQAELGIPAGAPVVGMVGNLYPVKGYPFFIKAMQRVKQFFPDANFLICGRGKLQNELEQLARVCGIAESIHFLGFRPDIPRLLQLMDVFVLSSLSEGLSLSILEAMAAGKPTVVTEVGGNREIVVEGKTGFLVPSQDAAAIAARVVILLRNKHLGIQMGQKGRERVQSLFSRQTMLTSYQNLYENLVQKRNPKKC